MPAGTKIPLILKQGITTKNAHVGDPVYAQTSFPITMNDHIAIPSGTLVQGEIRRVQRPGRVKGRAELLMNLTSMIFPNGYTIGLPGAVQGTPGAVGTNGVKDKEGTIAGDSGKEKDVGTIVRTAIPGAAIGAIADQGSGKGAAIGAASGGALGLATVLLTRGPEIELGAGASVEDGAGAQPDHRKEQGESGGSVVQVLCSHLYEPDRPRRANRRHPQEERGFGLTMSRTAVALRAPRSTRSERKVRGRQQIVGAPSFFKTLA